MTELEKEALEIIGRIQWRRLHSQIRGQNWGQDFSENWCCNDCGMVKQYHGQKPCPTEDFLTKLRVLRDEEIVLEERWERAIEEVQKNIDLQMKYTADKIVIAVLTTYKMLAKAGDRSKALLKAIEGVE